MYRITTSFAFTLILFVQTAKSNILIYSEATNQLREEFLDLPSRFGTEFPANGLRGFVIYPENPDACKNITQPPKNSTFFKWIALIARGNCSFEQKVRNAQAGGYSAVIVHNVNSDELEPMSANDDEGIDIPSMFVSATTGKTIIHSYLYNFDYEIDYLFVLNGELPFDINTHLIVPFAIVVALCFIVMIGFMIMKCLREQRRLRRHRLPGSVLKKIPIIRFSKEEHMSQYELCAICIEDYVDGDRLRVLPCSHAYHNKCIDPWLTKNRRVCPICKRKVCARGEPRRRRRRSTDDSMSESDQDDTRPLLNQVDTTNSHGTFNAAAPPLEEVSTDGANPSNRINPFNREMGIPPANVVDAESLWTRVFRTFFVRGGDNEATNQNLEPDQLNDNEVQNIMSQSQSNDAPIASYVSSNSNNLLNTNLSGSMKRFNIFQRNTNGDDSEDDGNDLDRFHDCNESNQPVFAPISTSQPTFNPYEHSTSSQSRNDNDNPPHQRIAVAALPNLEFDQFNLSRGFSASSPSLHSQPESNSRRNSGDSDQRRTNFIRNTPASSSNYFV